MNAVNPDPEIRDDHPIPCPVCRGVRGDLPCEFCQDARRLTVAVVRRILKDEARDIGSLQVELGQRSRRLAAWRASLDDALRSLRRPTPIPASRFKKGGGPGGK